MQQAVSQSLSMQRNSAEEKEELKNELTAERHKSAEQRAKLTVLEECCKRAEKLLTRMPPDFWRTICKRAFRKQNGNAVRCFPAQCG